MNEPPRRPPSPSSSFDPRPGRSGRIRPMPERPVEEFHALRRDPTMPDLPPGAILQAFADILPGQGNLDIRFLIASLVGPLRVAHGAKYTKQVEDQTPTLLANNCAGTHPWYIQVSLPFDNPGPVTFMFSNGAPLDQTNSIAIQLDNNVGQAGSTYRCVLGPKDELYAQAPGTGGVKVSVSQVMF